jgi:HEAT repeat protein
MLSQLRLLMRYGTISFTLFALEVALMLWLLHQFTVNLSGQLEGYTRFAAVLIALVLTALALLAVMGFQVLAHAARRHRERGAEVRLEAWTELWMSLLWNGSRNPARLNGVSARNDPLAGEALLRLRETLRGEDAQTASNLYKLHGLLHRDLEALWRNRDEVRVLALENLARARHPASLHALERSFAHGSPELKRLTVLTMARVCARLKLNREQLVRAFVPKLTRANLSSGTVERALVMLEGNSAPVLEAMLEPGAQMHVQAALKALGLVRALELNELCTHWLHHENLNLRCAAARALYQLGLVPESAEGPLRAMLEESAWETKAQAVLALTWIDAPHLDALLLQKLGDAHWWVRHNSAVALSKRGPRGVGMLRQAMSVHPDRFARDTARQQLIEIGAFENRLEDTSSVQD